MKKIIGLVSLCLLIVAITACSKTETTTTTTSKGEVDCSKEPSNAVCQAKAPVIENVDSITIPWGKEYDAKKNVKATDVIDGDISHKIVVTGTIDIYRSIEQKIEYKVVNSRNIESKITRSVTVDYAKEQDLIDITKNPDLVEEYTRGNNLDLSQPTTDSVTPGWNTWGQGGQISVSENELKVEVGTQYFQVSNNHNDLVKNQKYIVTFDVKADELHRKDTVEWVFKAIWGSEEKGWDPHREVIFEKNISTEYQTFAFMFQTKTATENVLCLISQELKNTLYFKNFKIYELFPVEKSIPVISGTEDVTLNWGQEFDPMKNVTAMDDTDQDLTHKIVVENSIDVYVPGEYEIVYKVKNSLHIATVTTRKVTVLPYTTEDLIRESQSDKHLSYAENNLNLSDGINHWNTWGMGGPIVNEEGTLKINLEQTYFQVSNNGNNWTTNQDYIFTFKVKADAEQYVEGAPFNFKIIVGSENGSWNPYFETIYPTKITTDWQNFAFKVNVKEGIKGVLCLIFEGVKNTVYIKDLTCTEMFPKVVPVIQGNTDLVLPWNSSLNLLEGMTAIDEIDGDISSKMAVSGFDPLITGLQNVKISVTNSKGGYAEVFRKVKVSFLTAEEIETTLNLETTLQYDANQNNLNMLQGTTGWTNWTPVPGGTFLIENQALTAQVKADYFQVANGGHALDKNKNYLFTFDAQALLEQTSNLEFSFRIIVGSEEEGWREDNIIYFDKNINTTKQTFNFVIKPKHDTKNVICFVFQGLENTITINNIKIYQLNQ